ncbi:MAG: cysteine hydrolase [Deltaproteobacteria bacterium]|nr:cysteine hydrolase [Deltaproteobacteria bacterium]
MDPQSTALVVVDMVRSHLDMDIGHLPLAPEDAKRVLKNVAETVIPVFRKHGRPIIFIQTYNRIDHGRNGTFAMANPFWNYQMENSSVPGVGRKRTSKAVEGSPVIELMPPLEAGPQDYIVVKRRYSPFLNTDMESIIQVLGLKSLVVVGINTNNCVLCTSFEAFNRDLEVIVAEDCCASMNGSEYHDAAIMIIKTALGWVIGSEQIDGILSGRESL